MSRAKKRQVMMMARKPRRIVEYRIYELPPRLPLVTLTGEQWRISDLLSSRLHFHNCLEIGLCHAGSGILGFDDGQLAFGEGDVTMIPRYLPHTTCSAPGTRSLWSYMFIDLGQMLPEAYPVGMAHAPRELAAYLDRRHLLQGEQAARIAALMRNMLTECVEPCRDSEALLRAYGRTLMLELSRLTGMDSGGQDDARQRQGFLLRPALEYIHAHYAERCTVEELAEICHLSETHFRRLFLSAMGMTPLHFVNETRIRHACAALSATDAPVTAIAQGVGMSSIASFSRNFRQIMGMGPREYRASAAPHGPEQGRQVLPYRGWTAAEDMPE